MDEMNLAMLWHDWVEPFCEMQCTVRTETLSIASAPFYVLDKKIRALSVLLKQFTDNQIRDFSWNNGIGRKAQEMADFSVSFCRRDMAGHIRCEVFLRVDDVPDHGCRLYVDGLEPTQLDAMVRSLDAMPLYDGPKP